jgi:hypothetical protein
MFRRWAVQAVRGWVDPSDTIPRNNTAQALRHFGTSIPLALRLMAGPHLETALLQIVLKPNDLYSQTFSAALGKSRIVAKGSPASKRMVCWGIGELPMNGHRAGQKRGVDDTLQRSQAIFEHIDRATKQ